METIRVHDKEFEVYMDSGTIAKRTKELASQLQSDIEGEVPLFISVLNGAFIFAADFMRAYKSECEISFIKLASYSKTTSTGTVKRLMGINEDLEGRTVVVLEDIIDTGNTLQELYGMLAEKGAKKLIIVSLFYKPEVYKKELPIDYVGFEIPDNFILGYGLDYDGLGRNLPDIYQIKN